MERVGDFSYEKGWAEVAEDQHVLPMPTRHTRDRSQFFDDSLPTWAELTRFGALSGNDRCLRLADGWRRLNPHKAQEGAKPGQAWPNERIMGVTRGSESEIQLRSKR
jgi:hypothetical protein